MAELVNFGDISKTVNAVQSAAQNDEKVRYIEHSFKDSFDESSNLLEIVRLPSSLTFRKTSSNRAKK